MQRWRPAVDQQDLRRRRGHVMSRGDVQHKFASGRDPGGREAPANQLCSQTWKTPLSADTPTCSMFFLPKAEMYF